MEIREASPEDTDGIRSVAKASWDTDYPDILSRESIEEGFDDWYAPDEIRESLAWANTLILVAEEDDNIVGFVHAVWDKELEHGDILRLYVHPDHRGVGLGSRLFEEIKDELTAVGVERLRAMVLEDNELGNAFYDGFGFEREDTQKISIGDESYRENTYVLDVSSA